MRRGEVWLIELHPRSGSEQQGTRPAIIVSTDVYNQVPGWKSFNVVPISSSPNQLRRSHTTILLAEGTTGLTKDSVALCHQITTVDRSKFIRKLGLLSDAELQEIQAGLLKSLGLLHLLT